MFLAHRLPDLMQLAKFAFYTFLRTKYILNNSMGKTCQRLDYELGCAITVFWQNEAAV